MNSAEQGRLIVSATRLWIGTPYQHQASLIGVGCDCLGLVRGVWRDVTGKEPERPGPYSSQWSESDTSERLLDAAHRHFTPVNEFDAQLGDVLVFRMRRHAVAKHLAIKSGDRSMIHAYDGNCVVEGHVSEFWQQKIAGVFRFPVQSDT